ncbi:MAG: bifunctional hydroxymethylpyrimidine kinase/phosphomethylpyrimidine kinase [Flavobacteriales bacterium]|nr:bifunctional hydroxymethylpyrimidine kinase/phosphomethylpyrimidine kinase [Flavobacteriales bacterium]MBK7240505.1 bifunctional hydroxymethylpyrimidine kinase/phosphomethylpyrimidine kinase [Flavobacteriales bacterium]MBK9533973.1 bifunctional hydroxymethylpyrimidine kinase/phosphomethylpyrimidine kinase [Flavobacteriales bacterium]MBP9139533.1 bifunctional hydroxymethylpyrimidine kinase/phosphomethylpyrimidine kinase [Flavobacteriales bacterium]HQV53003.1 PfkB family carbohydrate kinase [F
MELITVGTVAFDRIETPFGIAEKTVGGAATYISLAASVFLEKMGLVSVVGDDFPEAVMQDLRKRGVDLSGLEVLKGKESFFWSGKYHYDMNNRDTLETRLNVLTELDPVLPEAYRKASYVMLGNLDPTVQGKVLDQMDKRPAMVVMDTMNFWMDIAMDKLKEVIARVDILTINDAEARQLSGEHSLVKAAAKIMAMGPKFLVVKKGEHGALLFGNDRVFFAPALPLEDIIDPTGAGDTFAGGFIGYLAHTKDHSFDNLKRAIIVGSAMASFTCEKFGIERLTELSREDIDDRIRQFVELVDFDIELVAD